MRPFDMTKFRKEVSKSIPGLSQGFNDPKTWLSTGCYALNYLISGDFNGGLPLEGKFTMFAGDSGSGKSYIATANVVKACQSQDVYAFIIDTENALDESWLKALGVDTDPEKMWKVNGATIDDVTAYLMKIVDDYKKDHGAKPYPERPRMMIIIDSLGMLISGTQMDQAEAGELKGDLGSKAKQLTHMIRATLAKMASEPIGLIATNHVMDSQDKYQPDKIPGGKMLEFASSVIVQMNKYLLKEDEDGKKLDGGYVAGIRSTAVVRKSRYAKPFERIKIDIPYETGMNPYSGLFDLMLAKGVIQKDGAAHYTYTSPVTGEVFKKYRKEFRPLGILDQIMAEWSHWEALDPSEIGVGLTAEEEGAEA